MTVLIGLVAAVIVYQIAVIVVTAVAWRNPQIPPQRTPAGVGVEFETVRIPTQHACSLHAWWMPAGNGERPAVILVHGWGRNAERMLPYVTMLQPLGFHLLAFDARNHGLSDRDGHASMKQFSQDILAVAAFLAERPDVTGTRLGVVGLSIGGSAALHAAAHDHRLRAVVTVGSFAHPRDAMTRAGFSVRLLAPGLPLAFRFIEWRIGTRMDELAPERHIAAVSGSVLLIHGRDDRVVPAEHCQRLAAAAHGRATLWLIPGRGHSDPHLEDGFAARVRGFLAEQLG
jgi:pimeloyl-ACP methyl ester carboxylesterase